MQLIVIKMSAGMLENVRMPTPLNTCYDNKELHASDRFPSPFHATQQHKCKRENACMYP